MTFKVQTLNFQVSSMINFVLQQLRIACNEG